ncbi:MAG: hypothetical protein ACD_21C00119G0001 [uncultured bacterium]|nr:MAG: hypothetical protein ACD_21C00119G0001 [uncultured bacterium]
MRNLFKSIFVITTCCVSLVTNVCMGGPGSEGSVDSDLYTQYMGSDGGIDDTNPVSAPDSADERSSCGTVSSDLINSVSEGDSAGSVSSDEAEKYDETERYYQNGIERYDNGHYKEAGSIFSDICNKKEHEKWLDKQINLINVYFKLGMSLVKQNGYKNEYEQALGALEKSFNALMLQSDEYRDPIMLGDIAYHMAFSHYKIFQDQGAVAALALIPEEWCRDRENLNKFNELKKKVTRPIYESILPEPRLKPVKKRARTTPPAPAVYASVTPAVTTAAQAASGNSYSDSYYMNAVEHSGWDQCYREDLRWEKRWQEQRMQEKAENR